jgi:hypothetical protein
LPSQFSKQKSETDYRVKWTLYNYLFIWLENIQIIVYNSDNIFKMISVFVFVEVVEASLILGIVDINFAGFERGASINWGITIARNAFSYASDLVKWRLPNAGLWRFAGCREFSHQLLWQIVTTVSWHNKFSLRGSFIKDTRIWTIFWLSLPPLSC